jgi:hypothetical protein
MASATKEKKPAKRGKKTGEKRKIVDEIIGSEPKKRGRKPKAVPDVKPINRGVKKVNLGHRAALARRLGISTQTLYNREAVFDKCLPEYFSGLSYLPRRGGALKVIPDLTPYQQFCHFQLEALRESLRQSLGVKECTPTEMVIKNNLDHFDIDLFNKQRQLTVDVEVESSSIETV